MKNKIYLYFIHYQWYNYNKENPDEVDDSGGGMEVMKLIQPIKTDEMVYSVAEAIMAKNDVDNAIITNFILMDTFDEKQKGNTKRV